MAKLVIFQNDSGGVAVMTPSPEILKHYTVEQVAKKDVPAGKPFKIIDDSELPQDSTFRDAWEISGTSLVDGVGLAGNTFEEVL